MSRRGEVSQRFRDSIPGTPVWTTDIFWSNVDGVWSQKSLRLQAGSVNADSTSQVRWSCNLAVRGPIVDGSEQPIVVGDGGINNWATHLRVRHGIQYGPGDRELIGMGVYRVETVARASDDPGLVLITGLSFEQRLIDATFPVPRNLPAGDPKGRVLALVREEIPDANLYWDPRVSNDIWLPKALIEKDRWGQIDGGRAAGSVARSLGARIYTNGNGGFVAAPVPTLDDTPCWEAVAGPGGVLIKSQEQLDASGVKNQIIVTGESTSGSVPAGPVIVSDEDPNSRTYIRGRFGRRPMYYSSQNITSQSQALRAGRGILQPLLGLRQQATFDSLHDPLKEPGDVGEVEVPSGKPRVIIDAVQYDLLGGNLQATTRTTVPLPEEGTIG